MVHVSMFNRKRRWRNHMGEQEVHSPVGRPGSKVGSNQSMSPGARSNPSGDRAESVRSLSSNMRVSRNADEPAELKIVGPEE
jgi:hypothetical protein